jgi:hypothetical protein
LIDTGNASCIRVPVTGKYARLAVTTVGFFCICGKGD